MEWKSILSQEGQKMFAKSLLKLNLKKKRRVKKGGKWRSFFVVFFLFGILARFASALKLDEVMNFSAETK